MAGDGISATSDSETVCGSAVGGSTSVAHLAGVAGRFQWTGKDQYGPAAATDSQPGYSFSISPGFFKANEAAPRLARDINRWYDDVRQMIASGAPFQLITTFNEWGEGTSVESATEWQSASGYGAFLDALHVNGVH